MTGRLPGELKEGSARGGIRRLEIRDVGEEDPDRIAAADVTGLLIRPGEGEGKDDGVSGMERLAGWQREDGVAATASLDVRDPLFAGRIDVHANINHVGSRTIDAQPIARHGRAPTSERPCRVT